MRENELSRRYSGLLELKVVEGEVRLMDAFSERMGLR